jgi:hypothetical protein
MQQRGERNTEADGGGMGYSTPVWRRVNREPIWVVRLRRALETIGLPPRANTALFFFFPNFFWGPVVKRLVSLGLQPEDTTRIGHGGSPDLFEEPAHADL